MYEAYPAYDARTRTTVVILELVTNHDHTCMGCIKLIWGFMTSVLVDGRVGPVLPEPGVRIMDPVWTGDGD